MASFVERTRCPACQGGAITTLLSRDYAHPSVWSFVGRRYGGRIERRELAGRRHEVARCAFCSLLFQRYVLSDASLERLYDEWWEPAARDPLPPPRGSLDSLDSPDGPEGLEGLRRLDSLAARRGRGGAVLDLGAGRGDFCDRARAAGCDVVAVEISARRREQLRERDFEVYASAEAMPERRFDLVRCHEIVEHLPRPFETLATLRGLLGPGGRIELRVPNAGAAARPLERAFWSASDDALRPLEHVNGFTRASLHRLARRLDLDCVEPADARPRWIRLQQAPMLDFVLALGREPVVRVGAVGLERLAS